MDIIFKLLAFALPTRTVDAIVAVLSMLAKRLAEAEARQITEAAGIDAQISSLQDKRAAAIAEAERASRVGAKISDLIA